MSVRSLLILEKLIHGRGRKLTNQHYDINYELKLALPMCVYIFSERPGVEIINVQQRVFQNPFSPF